MTQKEIDLVFSLTLAIHEDKWFGRRKNVKDRHKVQQWVANELAAQGIYTTPVGSSWGVVITKEKYESNRCRNALKNNKL